MCGITGFIDFTSKSNNVILKKMTDALQHRGPDGDGFYFSENDQVQIGLGHRRLSIIDLSTGGSQPMCFDGMHITFNGEIYNYQEIKKELTSLGHSFQSHSDTEVILHSIREWGIKAIDRWKGMFSLVIHDQKNNEIICIRDRAGVKPFYYFWADDLFIFGSELKALMIHPLFQKNISVDAVASFLQYGYVPHPHCIFQNTFKLSPGHFLKLDLRTRNVAVSQYWNVYDYYNRPKLKIDIVDAKEETEKILKQAFQYRMVSDVPVGVFLSGGFDSTCVAALLQKDATEKIKTFTIGSTDKKNNEAPFAKEIAEKIGTDHSEHYCTHEEALQIIPELPYYYDEPFADSSAIPTILVSRMARKKVTVALSADAGDEIFAGYNRYDYLIRYDKKFGKIPHRLRKAMAGVMNNIPSDKIPYFRSTYNFHTRYQKLKGILQDPSPRHLLKNVVQAIPSSEIINLFSREVNELPTKLTSDEFNENFYDPLSCMLAMDYQTYMNDDILQKVDRATMSIGLEGREPFLDQDIIEWVAQLPSSYKYHQGEKKYLLKQIVYKYVPKNLMNRPKMGFAIPIDEWLSTELKDLVLEYLDEKKLSHGFFNKKYVTKLTTAFFNGRKDQHLKIWHLLMFQMWYEKWMS